MLTLKPYSKGFVVGRAAPFPGPHSSILWGGSDHHRDQGEQGSLSGWAMDHPVQLPLLLFPGSQ